MLTKQRPRRNILAGIPVTPDPVLTNGHPSPIVNQKPDQEGMAYAMLFQPRLIGTEGTVPLERQSTRQPVLKYRLQASLYYSRYRLGLQARLGYPTARGQTIINTAPAGLKARPTPVTSGRAAARQGVMGSPPRFRKALRAPVSTLKTPVYTK